MDELSIKEAAKALGVHADTVRRWISEGKIVAEKRERVPVNTAYRQARLILSVLKT